MKNPPFICSYPVQLNHISADGKMRSWSLFDCLQDAAGRHADELGLGLKQLRNSDLSWVLSRIRLKMEQFPEYGQTIKITTYPSGFDRLFAYRQFLLTDEKTGQLFGYAGSAWLTLNPTNFRPVSPAKFLTGAAQWEYDGEIYFQEEKLGKLHAPSPAGQPIPHRVSSAWIDYNRHLNNAYYAMFTEDWLGAQTGQLVRMTELQINFNSSTGLAQTLNCSGFLENSGRFYVEGINSGTGKNAFQAAGSCQIIQLP